MPLDESNMRTHSKGDVPADHHHQKMACMESQGSGVQVIMSSQACLPGYGRPHPWYSRHDYYCSPTRLADQYLPPAKVCLPVHGSTPASSHRLFST